MVTRSRFDNYSFLPGLGYRDYSRAQGAKQVTERTIATPGGKEQLVVEEMKIYNQHPPWWWLFIILGILLIIVGILNILFCVDYHFWCRFWTGVLLIIFGIVGAIHQGDYYKKKWKTWAYIIMGVITLAAVFACLAFAMDTFCHQLIEIAQFDDKDAYMVEMKFRYQTLQLSPRILLSDDIETNVWVCFALDGITCILLGVAFLVGTSVMYVIDRFYNSNWVITRRVEPFCAPTLFNPWGQVSLGQAQIFIGMVLQASVHGNQEFVWQKTYAPVWAGIIPILAGVFTALSLKSCGLKHRCWNIMSIILQIISAIISIVAIILVVIGMIENIRTLMQSDVMNYTDFAQRLMLASTFLFCISVIACLVNVIYSIALLIRLCICHCCSEDERDQIQVDYIYDEEPAKKVTYVTEQNSKVYGNLLPRDPRQPFDDFDNFETPYRFGRENRGFIED